MEVGKIILLVSCILLAIALAVAELTVIVLNRRLKMMVSATNQKNIELLRINRLSFDEIITAINFIINDVWDKQEFYYRITEITVIPDIQKDVAHLAERVINSISPELEQQASRFMIKTYLWEYITRQMQVRVINYQNIIKPSSK